MGRKETDRNSDPDIIDTEIVISGLERFYNSGSTLPVSARISILRKLRDNIKNRQDEIGRALYSDLRKSPDEAFITETGIVLDSIGYFISHLRRLSRPRRVRTSVSQFPGKARIIAEPYGTVLIISPWNYPFLLALDPLTAAVAAGNTVLLKPSEQTPATSAVISELIAETFPKGWVSTVEGGAEITGKVLEHRFGYIFYTGGSTVGRIILRKAAEHLTPATLELGGKSPVIVCRDADIPVAARRIVFGKFINCGQTCVAPDYILADKKIHDRLIQAIMEEIRKMYPPQSEDYGRIINRNHFDRLVSLMEGQNIIYGGLYERESLTILPTIIDMPSKESPLMQEEIFGPILPVLTFDKEEEAVKYIKSGEKPLAAYIFSSDRRKALEIAASFSFGGGCINDTILHMTGTSLPFGGVGGSGMGSYHGKYGFETFTHRKSILDRGTTIDPPLRYRPFTKWKRMILRRVIG